MASFEGEEWMDKGTLKSRASKGRSCDAVSEITAEEKRYLEEYLGVYVDDEETPESGDWKVAPFAGNVPESYVDFDGEEEEMYLGMAFETVSCLEIL